MTSGETIVFPMPGHERLGSEIVASGGLSAGQCTIARFANGELHATLATPVTGRACVLLGSVAPPDEQILSILLASHTLRKEGAAGVTALLPYLGYARQDKVEPARSLGATWVGALLKASGIHRVLTVDVHSPAAHQLIPVPLVSLSPAAILAAQIARLGRRDITVVAPDEGARARCEAVREAAGVARPVAHFVKTRTPEGIRHAALVGEVTGLAIIVDDILDTGGTLVSACEGLRRSGIGDILVMVSHGLFTGTGWRRLWGLGVGRIYCLDTVPLPPVLAPEPITTLATGSLLADALRQS